MAAIRLNRLGFVFQTFNLIAQLTALENVELPLALQGALSAADRRKRATRDASPAPDACTVLGRFIFNSRQQCTQALDPQQCNAACTGHLDQ